jgi:hypothetical protein
MAEAVAREAPGLPFCTHSQAGVSDHPVSRSWMVLSRFIRAQVNETRQENFGTPRREFWRSCPLKCSAGTGFSGSSTTSRALARRHIFYPCSPDSSSVDDTNSICALLALSFYRLHDIF